MIKALSYVIILRYLDKNKLLGFRGTVHSLRKDLCFYSIRY